MIRTVPIVDTGTGLTLLNYETFQDEWKTAVLRRDSSRLRGGNGQALIWGATILRQFMLGDQTVPVTIGVV